MKYWPALIFLLAVLARLAPGARTIDDAYITFRYARNILAGNGFLYNPGEAVLGTTTPLYTILMVLLGIFSGGANAPFPQLALWTNAIADGITCLLLLLLGRRLGIPWAGAGAALAWTINQYSVTFAIGGLETSVVIMLLLGTCYAHLHARRKLAAGLAALALLTRPDTLILLGPLGLDRLLLEFQLSRRGQPTPRRMLLGEALTFGLPVLAWGLFASLQFGSPLPHSITAKAIAYLLPGNSALVTLLPRYATPFADDRSLGVPGIWTGVFLYPFLCVVSALAIARREARAWPLLAYPWLYFVTFAAANPLIFRWYVTPPMPFLMLFSLAGLEQLLSTRRREAAQLPAPPVKRLTVLALLVLVIAVPFIFSSRAWVWQPDHGPQNPAPEMAWFQLELLYRQAANIVDEELTQRMWDAPLNRHSPVLAAGDVGVLGYYTPTRILDTVGLNSTVSTQYYPLAAENYVINYAIPTALILDQAPDFIVILEVYGRRTFLPDPAFQAEYRLLHKLPTDIYGSDGMLVFARK